MLEWADDVPAHTRAGSCCLRLVIEWCLQMASLCAWGCCENSTGVTLTLCNEPRFLLSVGSASLLNKCGKPWCSSAPRFSLLRVECEIVVQQKADSRPDSCNCLKYVWGECAKTEVCCSDLIELGGKLHTLHLLFILQTNIQTILRLKDPAEAVEINSYK